MVPCKGQFVNPQSKLFSLLLQMTLYAVPIYFVLCWHKWHSSPWNWEILLAPCYCALSYVVHMKVSQFINKMCSQHACSKPVNKFLNCETITSQLFKQACIFITTCQQAWNKQCRHNLISACLKNLVASLLKVCHNLCTFMSGVIKLVPRPQGFSFSRRKKPWKEVGSQYHSEV
jgi:hypothetical protein